MKLFDRLAIKRSYGMEGHFLITTLGLLSPGKGIQYALRGLGRFLAESCDDEQRQRIVYVIGGRCHPEFVKADGGKYYDQYIADLDKALRSANIESAVVIDVLT